MRLADAYPVIVTTRLTECRDFYTRWLGFQILFEASWFVYLASAGDPPRGVAFIQVTDAGGVRAPPRGGGADRV
jgi:catechol 2,3-dioxygenase-like lactoylglutathione lyase family enzyme